MEAQTLRAYFFAHSYLSSIQKGIQAQHCTVELFLKYHLYNYPKEKEILLEWAESHKTTIILDGGNQENLRQIKSDFVSYENTSNLPWGYFVEDNESLNGCVTCIGFIVPESIYKKEVVEFPIKTQEDYLANLISSRRLAI